MSNGAPKGISRENLKKFIVGLLRNSSRKKSPTVLLQFKINVIKDDVTYTGFKNKNTEITT